MTDLFDPLTPPSGAAGSVKARCSHPGRLLWDEAQQAWRCDRCGGKVTIEASRRGRNNRARGNAIERDVAKRLGLQRVGQYGGADDVRGAMFVGQVKSGASFPERLWRWLRAVPVNAGQVPILVVTDAPGPGYKRRGVVVVDLEDWISLHGEVPE